MPSTAHTGEGKCGEAAPARDEACAESVICSSEFLLTRRSPGCLNLTRSPVPAAHRSKMGQKRKEPPGNRAAPSSGRIVPTEAKPSELSGCILGAGGRSVKNKSET